MRVLDILGQSALLVSVISFALGFSILGRNVRNKLFVSFAVLTTLISFWAIFFFLFLLWPEFPFYDWHLVMNVWLAPAAISFIRFLIRIREWTSRRLLELSIGVAGMLTMAIMFGLHHSEGMRFFVLFSPALVLVQILQLIWIDYRLRRGEPRAPKTPIVGMDRKIFIYLGGIAVLCFCVMDHVPWLGRIVPSIANFCLTIYLFFLSQAVSQQRLLNFGAMVSRFLVLILVSFFLTGLYLLLVAWIENKPALFFLNSFIFSFFVVTLLEPLRGLVGALTQRLLGQKHQQLGTLLRETNRKVALVVDLPSLLQIILDFVNQTIRPEGISVFVLRNDGLRFRRVRGGSYGAMRSQALGRGDTPVNEIAVSNPLVNYCQLLRKRGELPILLDQALENERDRVAGKTQNELLTALLETLRVMGGNLFVPFFDTSSLEKPVLGFMIIHVPRPPEPWGANWGFLRTIYPFFEHVGESLRNMEIFVRAREKERLATLGQLAAGLAHEIRNPLGAIRGAAQFLDPNQNKEESQFLRIIIDEVDRLNHVVTQFLDYSKPAQVEFVVEDLNDIAQKTVDVMRASLPEGIHLRFHGPSGKASVRCSSQQIHQVLLNLLQNSVKSIVAKRGTKDPAQPGEIIVQVEVEGLGRARQVVLSVEDNGEGIKKENLEKIFIPFFTTSPSGTGLGLSISQKLIEANRGRIEIQSEEGYFTKVLVTLPFFEENQGESKTPGDA